MHNAAQKSNLIHGLDLKSSNLFATSKSDPSYHRNPFPQDSNIFVLKSKEEHKHEQKSCRREKVPQVVRVKNAYFAFHIQVSRFSRGQGAFLAFSPEIEHSNPGKSQRQHQVDQRGFAQPLGWVIISSSERIATLHNNVVEDVEDHVGDYDHQDVT